MDANCNCVVIDTQVSNFRRTVVDDSDDLDCRENKKAFVAVEYSLAVDFQLCSLLLRPVNSLGHKVIAIDIAVVLYRLCLCCQHIAAIVGCIAVIENCTAVALRQS